MSAYSIVHEEMARLPKNHILSKTCCNDFSGICNIDGKFVKVRGYEKKIPFIYAIDYHTHDIIAGTLARSESVTSFGTLLGMLREIGYPLRIAVGDDSDALVAAIARCFPGIPFQLCHTHYLENIRELLRIRTSAAHHAFFGRLTDALKRTVPSVMRMAMLRSLEQDCRADHLERAVVFDVWNRYDELFAFERCTDRVPHSNNLIEAFNSHLNGRLKTIKGFESFASAERWLNAWMIRRRTKPFTDCEQPFVHLNGKCSIELTMQSGMTLEKIWKILRRK